MKIVSAFNTRLSFTERKSWDLGIWEIVLGWFQLYEKRIVYFQLQRGKKFDTCDTAMLRKRPLKIVGNIYYDKASHFYTLLDIGLPTWTDTYYLHFDRAEQKMQATCVKIESNRY